jgi:hypothetical protein
MLDGLDPTAVPRCVFRAGAADRDLSGSHRWSWRNCASMTSLLAKSKPPLLPPGNGLQNSAPNRKWLTIVEKRALTWGSLLQPTLSTAVHQMIVQDMMRR